MSPSPPAGCFDSGTYYREGEKLPPNKKRPCEMCYCIKGFRKCVVKKCAPLIRGCVPKIPKEGSCCPTNYDCSRSLKLTRQVRQNGDDEPEDDIDFFSLLFGSEEPQEEVKTETQSSVIEVTTLQPFKALPSTEKSFFDFIRAGLEIIDANADKFALDDRHAAPLPPAEVVHEDLLETTTVTSRTNLPETSTAKLAETTQKLSSSLKPTRLTSTTKIKLPEKIVTSSSESTSSSPKLAPTSAEPSSTTPATAPPRTGTSELSKLSFLSFVREILS